MFCWFTSYGEGIFTVEEIDYYEQENGTNRERNTGISQSRSFARLLEDGGVEDQICFIFKNFYRREQSDNITNKIKFQN